jgi:AcrR family transcriptional regulator
VKTPDNPMCDRIMGAAMEAFVEHGYAHTSTLEIATRAGISKQTLYATFPTKQAVLLACVTSRASRIGLPPDLPVPRNRQMLASTLSAFGARVLLEVNHPHVLAMFRLAIAEARHSPEVAQTLQESRMAGRGAIAELVAKAQLAGLLADGDPREMMEQFFALLWGDLLISRLLGDAAVPKAADIETRAQSATNTFLKLYSNT